MSGIDDPSVSAGSGAVLERIVGAIVVSDGRDFSEAVGRLPPAQRTNRSSKLIEAQVWHRWPSTC
jgi:hypothetical protein